MKPKVYIATSIPSYLTAWRSRDIVIAGNQETTKEWWDRREDFELFISEFVVDANPAFRSRIEAVIRSFGYEPPIICTPLELLEI